MGDARRAVVDAGLSAFGLTCARGGFSATKTVVDPFGEDPNGEPFVVLREGSNGPFLGYFRVRWANDFDGELRAPWDGIDEPTVDIEDVFVRPETLPGGEYDG
ncbi:hypothetical protein [Haloarchaeobius sp. DFWS5]|uniref:hypothetical protein n=1 Tax=Haloarchaeobius sp. DFWS5 TaxID=3446114 RepID=UPI003EBD5193